MDGVSKDQLTEWRAALDRELSDVESKIGPLQSRTRELRSQIQAIDTLLKPLDVAAGGGTQASDTKLPEPVPALGNEEGDFTPTDAYWIPILESLEDLGGRGRTDQVLDLVEKKMAGTLKQQDHELLPSGISVRWRNRAQWQRQNMVHRGLIAANSPRGIWEITPAGREWLKQEDERLKSLLKKYGVRIA
jgi:hypothetical protein